MDVPRTDAPDPPRMTADPGAFAAWAGPALLPMTRLARRLFGTWRLETITQSGPSHVIGHTTLTFERRGAFFVGRGCPGFRARVDVRDHQLMIGDVAAAAGPVCPSNYTVVQRQQDSTVNSVLMQNGSVDWAVVDDQFAITRDGTQLTFVKELTTPVETALVGSWQLNTIAYGDRSSGGGKTPTTTVTMTLDQTGNYRASYRCGGKWGKALVDQTTIRFADSTYGGSDCGLMPGESADQHRVNAVLSGTASWR